MMISSGLVASAAGAWAVSLTDHPHRPYTNTILQMTRKVLL